MDSIRLGLSMTNKVLGPSSSTAMGHIAASTALKRMKLPKLSIAAFDGTYTKWMTFWDLYLSVVHDNLLILVSFPIYSPSYRRKPRMLLMVYL